MMEHCWEEDNHQHHRHLKQPLQQLPQQGKDCWPAQQLDTDHPMGYWQVAVQVLREEKVVDHLPRVEGQARLPAVMPLVARKQDSALAAAAKLPVAAGVLVVVGFAATVLPAPPTAVG